MRSPVCESTEDGRAVLDRGWARRRPAPGGAGAAAPAGEGAAGEAPLAPVLADPRLLQRTNAARRAALVRHLQHGQGNGHVARVLQQVQRQAVRPETIGRGPLLQRAPTACAEPAEAPPMTPERDPGVQQFKEALGKVAADQKTHPPAKGEAAKAQAAAEPPSNDRAAKAGANQLGEMDAQRPGEFDKKGFVAKVTEAVAAITPKSEEEAAKFQDTDRAGQVAGQVRGMVGENKERAAQPVKQKAEAAPDQGKVEPKPITPMAKDGPGPQPAAVGAAAAMPQPVPAEQLSLASTKCKTDAQMADAGVTQEQLARGNEPTFDKALDAKQKADAQAEQAPKALRADEQQTLTLARAGAGAQAAEALGGMHAGRAGAFGATGGRKEAAKQKEEAERAKIAGALEAIYSQAKGEVTSILDALGPKADAAFTQGEQRVRAKFEAAVARSLAEYKKRYAGVSGTVLEVTDKIGFTTMPPELAHLYERARADYLADMSAVIGSVADLVGAELTRAKARIAQARKQVEGHLHGLPRNLQKLGQEAAAGIGERFDALASDVDAKQDSLAQGIAQKYADALQAVDQRIADMKAANRSWVDDATDALGGAIDAIKKMKEMLAGVLAKAAGVIDTIIKDPIGFLGNLVAAIKLGLTNFVANIGAHLKQGLMGWLFGTLAEAGVQLPESFDLKGILQLVMQLLGLTYANLRARAVAIVGEKTVALLEKTVDVFKILVSEGPAGLWKLVVDKLSGLKDQVMEQIRGFVVTKVITAGVTWLVSMLNPASAFIKACKAIYDVVMFFVERGSQIMGLVNAVLDSVGAIAAGAIGGAAAMVEGALGKALPVAISFLASVLGLGGIAEKIKGVIETIQAPVNKMIDGLVMGAVKGFKALGGDKLLGLAERGVAWAKGKVKQGVASAKAKVAQAKDWVRGKAKGAVAWAKEKFYGGTKDDKQKRLGRVMTKAVAAVKRLGRDATEPKVKSILRLIRVMGRIPTLEGIEIDGEWAVHGEIQRVTVKTRVKKPAPPSAADLEAAFKLAWRSARNAERYKNPGDPQRDRELRAPKVTLGDHAVVINSGFFKTLLRQSATMTAGAKASEGARVDAALANLQTVPRTTKQIYEAVKRLHGRVQKAAKVTLEADYTVPKEPDGKKKLAPRDVHHSASAEVASNPSLARDERIDRYEEQCSRYVLSISWAAASPTELRRQMHAAVEQWLDQRLSGGEGGGVLPDDVVPHPLSGQEVDIFVLPHQTHEMAHSEGFREYLATPGPRRS